MITFNSQAGKFYFDMLEAYKHHNTLPNDYRNMSSMDRYAINTISLAYDEKLKRKQEMIATQQKMDAEVQRRMG